MSPPTLKRVFRYTVPIDDSIHEIPEGRVVHVDTRHLTEVEVWVEVTPAGATGSRAVQVFGTGHVVPIEAEHIGTALSPAGEVSDGVMIVGHRERGELVWHLYALPRKPELESGGPTA